MGRSTTWRILSGLGLAMLVTVCFGCARARVHNVQTDRSLTLPRPGRVLVFDFDIGAADVRVGTSPRRTVRNAVGLYVRESDVLAEAVSDTLASRMVDDLRARGFSAERAAHVPPPQINDLVIQGQFVQIDEGSATRRFVIGLGVGATELRTQVQVFQVTADGWRPVKQFETVAAGSRMPGAAFFVAGGAAAGTVATSSMITSGVGVVREIRASIDADARRTADQITSQLADLFAVQRW
jgi:uncharacterized protein DUF4410